MRLDARHVLGVQRNFLLHRLYHHRQPAHLAFVGVTLVAPHREQRRELGYLRVHTSLLNHQRIARSQGFHLGIRQRRQFHIFQRPDTLVALHHLGNEARLGLQGLPEVTVKAAFCDITVNVHRVTLVALPQDATVSLLHIAGPPWRIQVVQGAQPGLHIGAHPHLGGRPQQHPNPAFTHRLEQRGLLDVGFGIVHKGNLLVGNARVDQPMAQIVIHAEALAALGGRQIAEHQLCATDLSCPVPGGQHFSYAGRHLALGIEPGRRHHQPEIQSSLAAVRGDRQHVVILRLDGAVANVFRTSHQGLNKGLQRLAGRAGHDAGLAAAQGRYRQIQHFCRTDIRHFAKHRHQLGHVDEAGEPRVHAVATAVRRDFQRRHTFTKGGCPGVKLLQTQFLQPVGLQVAHHGVDLRHGVGDRCRRGKHHPALGMAMELHGVARLQEQVERAFRAGHGQTCHTGHLGEPVEVLVQMGLVNEQAVDAQQLPGQQIVLFLVR